MDLLGGHNSWGNPARSLIVHPDVTDLARMRDQVAFHQKLLRFPIKSVYSSTTTTTADFLLSKERARRASLILDRLLMDRPAFSC